MYISYRNEKPPANLNLDIKSSFAMSHSRIMQMVTRRFEGLLYEEENIIHYYLVVLGLL